MCEVSIACLYEDDEVFVLDKPSGMLVHRGWGVAETALVDYARAFTQHGAAHPIQRLDRSASGAVLFAKSADVARRISEWAAAGCCQKDYLALVRGELDTALDIEHAISRREDGPAVPARTLVEPLASVAVEPRAVTLVIARPLTGRLHQVRRHLKHANHPLLGDVRYGHGELNRAFREHYGLVRLALHAYRWRISRPGSGAVKCGFARIPDDLRTPLERIGFAMGAIESNLAERHCAGEGV